jgi:hypothetical protein
MDGEATLSRPCSFAEMKRGFFSWACSHRGHDGLDEGKRQRRDEVERELGGAQRVVAVGGVQRMACTTLRIARAQNIYRR